MKHFISISLAVAGAVAAVGATAAGSGPETATSASSTAHPAKAAAPNGAKGPADPYHWRNVEIGGTGFVTGIIFHPTAPGVAYARTDIGGAYRWDPAEKRWVAILDWIGGDKWWLLGGESLALDPQDPRRVYIAAGMYSTKWAGDGAILRSSDQGKTWKTTPVPFKFGGNEDGRSIGERLAVDPNLSSRLLLGTRHDGLWKSEDFGATWKQDAKFPMADTKDGVGIGFVLFDAGSGKPGKASSTIYVGVATPGTSLYRSTDAGATWNEVAEQPRGMIPHHGVLTPDGILYLTYGNKPGPNGVTDGAVWKLDPAKGSWTNITPAKPGANGEGAFGYAGLAVDAKNPRIVMVSTMDRWNKGDDIFRSTDGGAHWVGLKGNATNDASATPYILWAREKAEFGHWIGDVEIDPADSNRVLYTTGQTIWGTDDVSAADRGQPTAWKICAQGIEETAIQSLLSPPSGPPLISGVLDAGGFRHDDLKVSPPGGIWTNPTMNSVYSMDFAQKNPAIVARVGSGSAPGAYSTDGAKTWLPFGGMPATSKGVDAPSRSIAISADGGAFVWVAPDGFAHVSRDGSVTWQRCDGLGPKVDVVSDRVNPSIFYALATGDHALYASSDAGRTFKAVNRGLPAQAMQLRAAVAREGDLWLTSGDGLWHSEDGGAHFAKLENVDASETLGFGKAATGRTFDAIYLVGTVKGVHGIFRSDDNGAKWVRINDDEHRWGWIGKTITGDPRRYGRVYLGTNGRGIVYGDPAAKNETPAEKTPLDLQPTKATN
jgi:hypothetical protein